MFASVSLYGKISYILITLNPSHPFNQLLSKQNKIFISFLLILPTHRSFYITLNISSSHDDYTLPTLPRLISIGQYKLFTFWLLTKTSLQTGLFRHVQIEFSCNRLIDWKSCEDPTTELRKLTAAECRLKRDDFLCKRISKKIDP